MRHFPNFLDAYLEYAEDSFCPSQFHLWTGLTVLSAALERKVWLAQSHVTHTPNIYTLLVSHPAVGKSTALDRGTYLLEEVKKLILETYKREFQIIPSQTTEAALVDLMRIQNSFQVSETKTIFFSSGFFYASEASSSALKNEHGDFNATLTAFYDCPTTFRKKLKGEPFTTEIQNVSFTLLAGTTFDFLKRLVNEDSVMGGLASRFIYVVCKDRIIRKSRFYSEHATNQKKKSALIADLFHISQLQGKFTPTPGYIDCWEKSQPEFDKYLISLDSVRMESIMARKQTNTIKVSMLLSAAESDKMELTEEHWGKASELMEEVTKDNSFILGSALMAKAESQAGINQMIMRKIGVKGNQRGMKEIKQFLAKHNVDASRVDISINELASSGQIMIGSNGKDSLVKLLVDPDACL